MTISDIAFSEEQTAELLALRKEVDEHGNIAYHNQHGELHRIHGPAVIYPSGNTVWYLYGKLHREDGPAVISTNGNTAWYLYGKLHREDGPAVEWFDGRKEWYKDGILHRIDYCDGTAEYFVNGVFV